LLFNTVAKNYRPVCHLATLRKKQNDRYMWYASEAVKKKDVAAIRLCTQITFSQSLTMSVSESKFRAQEINSFGWYHDAVKIHQSQPNIYTLF